MQKNQMTIRRTRRGPNSTTTEVVDVPQAEEQEQIVSTAEIAKPPVVAVEEKKEPIEELVKEPVRVPKTSSVFLGEEDRRLLKKFNSHIVKKLGLTSTRSFKV